MNKVYLGDCLEVMKSIADKSIDMILCDLPYGTTACKWDTIISFEPLWEQYKRIIKDNGAIVLTASQPFTSALVMSNPDMFKYCWIWQKNRHSSPLLAKKQPLRIYEDICVFYKKQCTYNPQGIMAINRKMKNSVSAGGEIINSVRGSSNLKGEFTQEFTNYPIQVQKFDNEINGVHGTQKPVALFEYLIKTYTNEGDIVLDNCAGSFTTAIAAENTKRNWICMEQLEEYCEIGKKRINENRLRLGILDNCDIIK